MENTRGASTKAVDRAAGTRDQCSQNDFNYKGARRIEGRGSPASGLESSGYGTGYASQEDPATGRD